jgi:hypothetical protein
MQRETLGLLYRRALENVKKNQINIDELSEMEFMSTYNNDPFFQARVNVEIEKAMPKIKANDSTTSIDNEEDWETVTLKKKSSKEHDKYIEKCKRYIGLIASCK